MDNRDTDTISRRQTLEHLKKRLYESALNNDGIASKIFEEIADNRVQIWVDELPPSPTVTADTDTISRQTVLDGKIVAVISNQAIEVVPVSHIDDIPQSPSRPQWIPVTERLPEEDGDYWVTVDPRHVPPRYKSTDVITWHNGKWMMADYFVIDGEGQKKPKYIEVPVNIPIIAWMPLPEPYHRN